MGLGPKPKEWLQTSLIKTDSTNAHYNISHPNLTNKNSSGLRFLSLCRGQQRKKITRLQNSKPAHTLQGRLSKFISWPQNVAVFVRFAPADDRNEIGGLLHERPVSEVYNELGVGQNYLEILT